MARIITNLEVENLKIENELEERKRAFNLLKVREESAQVDIERLKGEIEHLNKENASLKDQSKSRSDLV